MSAAKTRQNPPSAINMCSSPLASESQITIVAANETLMRNAVRSVVLVMCDHIFRTAFSFMFGKILLQRSKLPLECRKQQFAFESI
jgi:hypothetical protein